MGCCPAVHTAEAPQSQTVSGALRHPGRGCTAVRAHPPHATQPCSPRTLTQGNTRRFFCSQARRALCSPTMPLSSDSLTIASSVPSSCCMIQCLPRTCAAPRKAQQQSRSVTSSGTGVLVIRLVYRLWYGFCGVDTLMGWGRWLMMRILQHNARVQQHSSGHMGVACMYAMPPAQAFNMTAALAGESVKECEEPLHGVSWSAAVSAHTHTHLYLKKLLGCWKPGPPMTAAGSLSLQQQSRTVQQAQKPGGHCTGGCAQQVKDVCDTL